MKKTIKYIILLIIALTFYVFLKLLPDIYSDMGQKAYYAKNYSKAYHDLKQSLFFNPNDLTARRFYAKTLITLKPSLEVQHELYNLTQTNLNDSAKLTAEIKIQTWKNAILSNAGQNYIEKVPYNNLILRWDIKKFPIKVCIENDSQNAPTYYTSQIKKAFVQWTYSTKFIKFKFTDNPKDSDIYVLISPSTKMQKCEGVDCKYTVAYTTPEIQNNLLKKMNIFFYDSNNLSRPFTDKEIYNTALHEIGHALGIMGHSENINDVMYMETSSNKLQMNNGYVYINQSDLNTLKLLYSMVPDITNTDVKDYNASRQFFASIVMGNEEEINSQKIQEALNYIKNAPNLPNGYIDLAAGYAESKKYLLAINSLNKALELSTNDSEKFIIYYNFSILYKEIKDFENALKYAQSAEEINSPSDLIGLIASIYYNKGDKELAKQTYKKAIEKDPQNIINSLNYAIIYLKEYNFIKTGEIIKNLIKANPDARDDSRVKGFLIYTYL